MGETSGFFEAVWDETIVNPITGDNGYWDRNYLSEQFAKYFSSLIGNGVLDSPINQLSVIPGIGLTVIVKSGYAFINGYWYYNDSDLTLTVPPNSGVNERTDSVKIRFSLTNRSIEALYSTNDTTNTRTSNVYDLQLAQVVVPPSSTGISSSNITDMRSNTGYCGFVSGLLSLGDAISTLSSLVDNINSYVSSINLTKGSATKPVYFDNGVPTPVTYELKKTVPEDAVFTDTTYSPVTQNANGLMSFNDKVKLDDLPNVVYTDTEPSTVAANTIVFVYD